MAGPKSGFANRAVITVTESAANTLTFAKLETGVSIFDKVAWIVHRVDWYMGSTTYGLFNTTADYLKMALVSSNTLSDLAITTQGVLAFRRLLRVDLGTAASGMYMGDPLLTDDFSKLPQGGLIIPPAPLYAAAYGNGLSGASTTFIQLWYSVLEMKPEDYWDLVESTRVLS